MTKKPETEVTIMEVNQGELDVCIVGNSPLIYNAMSKKALGTILMGGQRKNAAERAAQCKHNPVQEYRDSVYRDRKGDKNTRLNFPVVCFKNAMANAALDMPGTTKSQLARLVWVVGDRTEIYGIPQLFMAVVRSADINKTPDIRTRAILPEWACKVSMRFMRPLVREQTIASLLSLAGLTNGVGDFRQQKGKGNYGQFRICSADDPDFVRICKKGTLAAQDAALEKPEYYDEETERLMAFYDEEFARRFATPEKPAQKNGKNKQPIAIEAMAAGFEPIEEKENA